MDSKEVKIILVIILLVVIFGSIIYFNFYKLNNENLNSKNIDYNPGASAVDDISNSDPNAFNKINTNPFDQ